MPVRSLNGLDTTVRSLNGLSDRIDYTVSLPLTMDSDYNIKLSNLTTYGSANQILKMNGTGTALEFTNETDTTYTGGTNISINETAINLDTNLTNLETINTFKIGGNATSENTLLRNNGNLANGDYLKINSEGRVIGLNTKDTKNNILGVDNTSGIITGTNISKSVETLTGNITINLDSIITIDRLNITQGNSIFLKGNNDENHFIKYVLDGVEVGGFGSNDGICFQVVNTKPLLDDPPGTPIPVFQVYRDKIISKQDLILSSKSIFLKDSDVNHFIKYVFDGVEVGGFGSNNAPCFQIVNTGPLNDTPVAGVPIPVFQVYRDKIISKQNLNMTSKAIYFKDDNVNNYIKYQSTGDCLELGAYSDGDNDDAVFKFVNTFNSELLVSINKGNNTFEKTTYFNNDLQMVREKYLYFDVGLLSNNNWIKATSEDGQDGLKIQGSADVLIATETYSGKIFLNENTLEISANLTTFDNDITATFCDISLDGDFVGTDCDLTIDGDMRIGQDLNMRDNTNLGQINMADGAIYYRNGYKTGTDTYAIDTNHYSQYNGFPVDGIRHQGWNGVALGYTNGGARHCSIY